MMDSGWVNRAGILAEGVSFVLIAPEILGEERLRNVEEALKEWLGGVHQRTRRLFWIRAVVALVFIIAMGLALSAVPYPRVPAVAALAVVGFGIGTAWASVDTQIVLVLVGAVRRLLTGPNRLRALVFGTGVVLLFGGLGAQFYATF
jgi:hypothetical protein